MLENTLKEGPRTPGGVNNRKDWNKVNLLMLMFKLFKIEESITCELYILLKDRGWEKEKSIKNPFCFVSLKNSQETDVGFSLFFSFLLSLF